METTLAYYCKNEKLSLQNKEKDLEYQIFYDNFQKIFIYRCNNQVIVKGIEIEFKFEINYKSVIYAMIIDRNCKYCAYKTAVDTIVVQKISIESSNQELQICLTSKKSELKTIFLFEWLYKLDNQINFMIVDNYAIHLYKFGLDDQFSMQEIKQFQLNTVSCWFEPYNEILITHSQKVDSQVYVHYLQQLNQNKLKPQVLKLDFSNGLENQNKEKSKQSLVQNFFANLTQQPVVAPYYAQSDLRNQDILKKDLYSNSRVDLSENKLFLTCLYEKSWLIHINSVQGKFYIYHLSSNSSKQNVKTLIQQIPSDGIYGFSTYDNLIILHNYSVNISMIYDIKRYHIMNPIGYPGPIQYLDNSDLKQFEDFDTFSLLNNQFCINKSNYDVMQLQINLNSIKLIVNDKVDAFFIMLRRFQCKEVIFELMTNYLKSKIEIMYLSYIFRNINEIYKKGNEERQSFKNKGQKLGNELKIKNGYTILLHQELLNNVFQPLFELEDFDQKYLISILKQFIRETIDCDISILPPIQNLLLKLLVRNKKFIIIHSLLQYSVLQESEELAEFLFQLYVKNSFQPGLQLSLDILFRLKQFNSILNIYLDQGMIFEAFRMLKKYDNLKLSLESLFLAKNHQNCNMNENAILENVQYLMSKKNNFPCFNFTFNQIKQKFEKNVLPFECQNLKSEDNVNQQIAQEDRNLIQEEDKQIQEEDKKIQQEYKQIQEEDQKIIEEDKQIQEEDHQIKQEDELIQDEEKLIEEEDKLIKKEEIINQNNQIMIQEVEIVENNNQKNEKMMKNVDKITQERINQNDKEIILEQKEIILDDPLQLNQMYQQESLLDQIQILNIQYPDEKVQMVDDLI